MNKKDDVPNFDYFPQNTNANELSKPKQQQILDLATKSPQHRLAKSSKSKSSKKSSKNFNPQKNNLYIPPLDSKHPQKLSVVKLPSIQKNSINTSPPPQKFGKNQEYLGQDKPDANVKKLNKSSSKKLKIMIRNMHPNNFMKDLIQKEYTFESVDQKSKNTLRRPSKKLKSQKKLLLQPKKQQLKQDFKAILKDIAAQRKIKQKTESPPIQKLKTSNQLQKIHQKVQTTNLYFNQNYQPPKKTQSPDSRSFHDIQQQEPSKTNQKNNFVIKKSKGRVDQDIKGKIMSYLQFIDVFVKLINDPTVKNIDIYQYPKTHLMQRKFFLQQLDRLYQRVKQSKQVENVKQLSTIIKEIFEDNHKIQREYMKKYFKNKMHKQYSNIEREMTISAQLNIIKKTEGQESTKFKLLKKCLKVIKYLNEWRFSNSIECYF